MRYGVAPLNILFLSTSSWFIGSGDNAYYL
jgi:hypothetical protein